MQAVILAGGQGLRLRPATNRIPKPMMPVFGKPFLQYQLELLKKSGITDILLCVGYLRKSISDYFRNGKKFGLAITYSVEKIARGTGGALKLAEENLDREFFVLYGDSYLSINYRETELTFRKKNKKGMVVVFDNAKVTDVKNNIAVDRQLQITGYQKKGTAQGLGFVDAGVMLLKKEILRFITSGKFVSLEEEIFPCLIRQKELLAYPSQERFYDIGTPERLVIFENYLKGRRKT